MLLTACAATAASRPPVRQVSQHASTPKANRSTNSAGFCPPCASAKSRAETAPATTAT